MRCTFQKHDPTLCMLMVSTQSAINACRSAWPDTGNIIALYTNLTHNVLRVQIQGYYQLHSISHALPKFRLCVPEPLHSFYFIPHSTHNILWA